GEAGYYFTNLCCATSFIEKICGKSLNMSEDDFQVCVFGLPLSIAELTFLIATVQSYMLGESQPPDYYKQSFLCEPFRIMTANLSLIGDTVEQIDQCQATIDALDKRMDRFGEMLESRHKSA